MRCMMLFSGVPMKLWAEAACCAAYLVNRTSTKAIEMKTPEEVWSGRRPSVSHLRIFGCKAFSLIPKQLRHKLEATLKEGIMVGYPDNSAGYRVWTQHSRQVCIS